MIQPDLPLHPEAGFCSERGMLDIPLLRSPLDPRHRSPLVHRRSVNARVAAASSGVPSDGVSLKPDVEGHGSVGSNVSSPLAPSSLVLDLGILRAGSTGRRRFNVTNLNPVALDLASPVGGGTLPFASLTLLGTAPLSTAPQTLLEIGSHMKVMWEAVMDPMLCVGCLGYWW